MKKTASVLLSIMLLLATFLGTVSVDGATMPSCTDLKVSSITTNSARVDFNISNPSKLTVKTCGMQIRKSGTSTWSKISETVNASYQKKASIPCWYTIGKGKEFNYSLSAGTKYEYRALCVYNGKTYYSSTKSFTTTSSATIPSCADLKVSSITTNSARVDFNVKNPSKLTVKTIGMQIRKSGTSTWTSISETVNSSYQKNASIPCWYTIGKGKEFAFTLSASTKYEYRCFCKYNDKTYYSSTATFTTKANTTKIATLMWPVHDASSGKALKNLNQGFSSSHHGIDISASKGQKWHCAYGGTIYAVYTGCKTNGNGNHKNCNPNHGRYTFDDGRKCCNNGLGNGVIVKCTINGTTYYMQYAHMNSVSSSLKEGDKISKGKNLGTVGDRGYSFGAHAHFEVNKTKLWTNYQNVDPNSSSCVFKYDYSSI